MSDERRRKEPIRLAHHQMSRDERAHRESDDVRAADVEVIEQPHDVAGHLGAVGGGIPGLSALAMAAAVDRDHPVIARKAGKHARVDPVAVAVARVAVDQHDGRTASLIDVADTNAVRIEESVLRRAALQPDGGDQGCRNDRCHISSCVHASSEVFAARMRASRA